MLKLHRSCPVALSSKDCMKYTHGHIPDPLQFKKFAFQTSTLHVND